MSFTKPKKVSLYKSFFNLLDWLDTPGVIKHHQQSFVDKVRLNDNHIVGHGTHVYLDTAHVMKILHQQDTSLVGVDVSVANMVGAWGSWYAFVFGEYKLLLVDFAAFNLVSVLTCGPDELREIGVDPNHRVFLKQSKGVTQMSTKDHIEEFKTLFLKHAQMVWPAPYIHAGEWELALITNTNLIHLRLGNESIESIPLAEGKFKRTTKPLENAPSVKPSANTAYVDFAQATDSFMNNFIDTTLLEDYVGIHRVVNKLKNFLSDKIKQDYTTANPQSTENIVSSLFDFGVKDTVKTVSPSAKSDKPVWTTMPNTTAHASIERLKRFIKNSGGELNTNVGIFRYNVKTDGFVFIMYDAFNVHYLLSVQDLVDHAFLPIGERFIFKHLGGSKVVVNISETVPVLEFIPKSLEGYDWKAYQAKIDEGETEIPSSNDLLLKFKTELAAEVPVLNVLTKDVLVQLIYFNVSLTDPDNKLSVEQDSKFVQLLSRLPSADMWFKYVSV